MTNETIKGDVHSEVHKKKIAQSVSNHWKQMTPEERDERRAALSKGSKGKGKGNQNSKGCIPWNKGTKGLMPPVWNKGIPMSKETKEKMMKSLQKAWHTSPNKEEQRLIKLMEEYNLPYKFVGDFSFILAGKNPDFINTNGSKKVIEHAGTFFHTPKEMEERSKLFANYGYKTLVTWSMELRDEETLIEKIKQFELE